MSKPKDRCVILIDGSNFFFKLKDLRLSNLLSFDFAAFNKYLCRDSSLVLATATATPWVIC